MSKKVNPAKLGNRKNFFMLIASMCFTNATLLNWIKYRDIEFFILFSIFGAVFLFIALYYRLKLKKLE